MKLVGLKDTASGEIFVSTTLQDPNEVVMVELSEFWDAPATFLASPSGRVLVEGDLSDFELAPPIPADAKVFCIGLNYRAHVEEGLHRDQLDHPYPTIFARWTQSLTVSGESIAVPASEKGLDWEGEVAAVIGKQMYDVSADEARAGVLGFAAFNDLSARNAQYYSTQWVLGKNADKSGPLGPIVTADEVGDLRDGLRLETRVNGELVQQGNTRDMIYELGEVLSLISKTVTLRPGDVICTGTPSGIGYVREPRWLLTAGDTVSVTIDKLGTLENYIE